MKDWLWFISSYAPLWAMFALRFDALWLRTLFGALCVGGVLLTAYLLRRNRRSRPENHKIEVVGDGGAEVSGYLAAYLLPFLTLAAPPLLDGAAYLIFLIVAGLIYVRSGLLQVNPTVYLLGWRVVTGTMSAGSSPQGKPLRKKVYVFSRSNRRVGDRLYGERFSDRVYIDHTTQQEDIRGDSS